MSEPLFLMHTQPDHRRLLGWAAQRRLLGSTGRSADLGYAVHALLHAAFGSEAPRPFSYDDDDQGLLAYTGMTPERMAQAVALADPDVVEALGLGTSALRSGYRLRAFPTDWARGHVLGFTVRVRPIEREGKSRKERDAFLAPALASPDQPLRRESVYTRWLADQLAPRAGNGQALWQGGAELIGCQLTRFSLTPVLRRTQQGHDEGRRSICTLGPDATLCGHLRVLDPASFSALIARGVGRHRAFGFGMLRLRPAFQTT